MIDLPAIRARCEASWSEAYKYIPVLIAEIERLRSALAEATRYQSNPPDVEACQRHYQAIIDEQVRGRLQDQAEIERLRAENEELRGDGQCPVVGGPRNRRCDHYRGHDGPHAHRWFYSDYDEDWPEDPHP